MQFFSNREKRLKDVANAYIRRQQLRGVNKTCKWYPCHKKVPDCTFCVCPFYPCQDTEVGGKWYEWEKDGVKGKVWDCTNCNLNHKKEIASQLLLEIKDVYAHAENMGRFEKFKSMYLKNKT